MAQRGFDLSEVHCGGGYSSEFDEQDVDTCSKRKTWRDDELSGVKRKSKTTHGLPSKRMVSTEYSREEARSLKDQFVALDAYSRHKKMINDYVLYYGHGVEHYKRDSSRDRTDFHVIKEAHRFIWNEEDDSEATWEKRLAKKYYDKLFKEYCISDLCRYKENKVALRWRIEKEVLDGKGQFTCGDKKCAHSEGLKSWEVNFAYIEHKEKKNALVKLRLCPDCSYKLNYHHKKKLAKKMEKGKAKKIRKAGSKKKKRKKGKHRRDKEESLSDSCEDSAEDSDQQNKERVSTVDAAQSGLQSKGSGVGEDVWKGPAKVTVDKTREEEFEEYLQDMFL